MDLYGRIYSGIDLTYVGDADVGSLTQRLPDVTAAHAITTGTGANQANALFTDTRALAASGSENLDLASGLTNAFGTTLVIAAVKAIRVRADASNGGNIVVGGAATNAFTGPFGDATDTLSIPAGGQVLLVNPTAGGWAVTAGTGDILKVANSDSGAAASYTIEIIGEV